MKLAVCLLTWERPSSTLSTLHSFRKFNKKVDDHLLLHIDDQSHSMENASIAARYGFKTVSNADLKGPAHCLRHVWKIAIDKGATHILHLENDWMFNGKLPLGIEVDCVRLYGERKQMSGPRAKTGKFIVDTNELINWKPFSDRPGWQIGVCHWGGPPSITVADKLYEAAMKVSKNSKIQKITKSLPRIETARPKTNIVWHIG